ncbi:MAG: rod shape-determining protein MreC [Lachnospiraceae bacterium]|nr:rod shape-determining protein MreC [Lachnospiraceae bacterium]
MRRRSRFKIPTKYILLALTVFCIAAMYISFSLNLTGGPLNTVAGAIFGPMQRGINVMGTWISDKADNFKQLNEVMAENEELKSQVEELTQELNETKLEQYELENLRELLELDKQYSDYDKTAANVIGKDAGNWFQTFIIDKGSKDGIEIDMNVIADGGLVGIVYDVGPHYAKVRSIIDDTSQVYGMVLSTSDNCVISGNLSTMSNDQVITFSNLNDSSHKVQIGDQVVTSNVSSKYLEGILVGYISTISDDSNNLTRSGTLTPAVDFEHLQQVLVILEKKETGEEE